jgi:type I restriction enzyme M protein
MAALKTGSDLMNTSMIKDQSQYKKHIDLVWTIANLLRGPYRPPQYRRVMVPLTVLCRLDCVLEDSKKAVMKRYAVLKAAEKYDDETIEKIICQKFKLNFFNISGFTFAKREQGFFAGLLDDADNLPANLAKYMAGFSGNARKILEKFKFEEEIEKLDESNRLFQVIQEFKTVDFHPDRVPNMAMGYIFEDLVRCFNEQANEEAGDHFTPREVISLMVHILYTYDEKIYDPGRVVTIYDPTVGTGGMLSVSEKYILEHNKEANLELFGQEYNPESFAICGSDLMIKGEDVSHIVFGNTLGSGRSKNGAVDGDGHPNRQFHYMLANPPFGVEWKPEQDHVTREHNELGFDGRFGPGLPRINDGALLFLLHMIHKMQPSPEQGFQGLAAKTGWPDEKSPPGPWRPGRARSRGGNLPGHQGQARQVPSAGPGTGPLRSLSQKGSAALPSLFAYQAAPPGFGPGLSF